MHTCKSICSEQGVIGLHCLDGAHIHSLHVCSLLWTFFKLNPHAENLHFFISIAEGWNKPFKALLRSLMKWSDFQEGLSTWHIWCKIKGWKSYSSDEVWFLLDLWRGLFSLTAQWWSQVCTPRQRMKLPSATIQYYWIQSLGLFFFQNIHTNITSVGK